MIAARYVAGVVELNVQEAAAVAFAEMAVGAVGQATVSPLAGVLITLRLAVPAKLNVLVRVTDTAAPVAPELKLTGLPTEIMKSPT